MRYGDFLGSLSLASSHSGGFPYSIQSSTWQVEVTSGQPAQAAPQYSRIRSMRSLSMCPIWRRIHEGLWTYIVSKFFIISPVAIYFSVVMR